MLQRTTQFKRGLMLLAALSIVIFSCKKEDKTEDEETETTRPPGNFTASFSVDGTAFSLTDIGNAALIPGAVYISRIDVYDTLALVPDTIVKRTVAVGAQYMMTYSDKTSKVKLIITTDSVKYVTSSDTTLLLVGTVPILGYKVKSNYDISHMPADPFFYCMTRSSLDYADTTLNKNGYVVSYVDENGKMWSSKKGTQSGAVITASQFEKNVFSGGVEYVKTALTFNCKVYNGSEIKTITSGALSGYFINSR